jgi:hypothetical protein
MIPPSCTNLPAIFLQENMSLEKERAALRRIADYDRIPEEAPPTMAEELLGYSYLIVADDPRFLRGDYRRLMDPYRRFFGYLVP